MSKKKKVRAVAKKAKGTIGRVAQRYADANTKGNWHMMLGESLTTVAGSGLSGALGGFGKGYVSIIVGLASIVGGNLMKDPTKLSTVFGASMIGYGIGKYEEHKALANSSGLEGLDGAKSKLGQGFSKFVSEITSMVGMKKTEESQPGETEGAVGSIDVSVLDQFEDLNRMEAIRFDEQQREMEDVEQDIESAFLDTSDEDDEDEDLEGVVEEFAFAQYEDADLSTI